MASDQKRRIVVVFILALLLGSLLGSLVQTQINLLALQAMGIDIELGVRIETSGKDLIHFGPVYIAILGTSFLLSQSAALLVGRKLSQHWQAPLCAVAAALGLWLAFKLVDALAPMPTLIAATREASGMSAMLASAALAGWLFGRLATGAFGARDRKTNPVLILMLASGLLWPDAEPRAQEHPDYRVETLAQGLEHPWSLVFLPEGGALVTERPGRLRRLNAEGQLEPEPLTGVPEVFASGQAGLKDILLAPDFAQSGILFLSYACGTLDANHTCLARARLGQGGLEQVEEVFRTQPAKKGNAHYGGRMVWLPDGTLILTLGDGFDYREQAQNLANHLGTIVRLNPDGSAPDNNPFVGQANARAEIYSYGHRNVQGLVYDQANNRLISHEHGPRGGDEINIIAPGNNYGWPVATHGLDYTGARVTPFTERNDMVSPLLHWTPSIAPSGMTLYTGDLFPQWRGSLLVGALAARQVHRVTITSGRAEDRDVLFAELAERIRTVKTGPDGAVYLLTDSANGKVLRVLPH